MIYKMEELLPVVAKLTRKYTGNESTSVTWETAQKLMEAVIYCICMAEDESKEEETVEKETEEKEIEEKETATEEELTKGQRLASDRELVAGKKLAAGKELQTGKALAAAKKLAAQQSMTASQAYERGYRLLIARVRAVKECYNQMILKFCAFENENYYDTVTKALPGFFRYYDPKFAPQDTIITMDYPVLSPGGMETGILAVEKYVKAISSEQRFLQKLPREYVVTVLQAYQGTYRRQLYNISRVVFRHMLGRLLIGKNPGLPVGETKENYGMLEDWVLSHTRQEMKAVMEQIGRKLVVERLFQGEPAGEECLAYFVCDLDDFTVELLNAAVYHGIRNVVVL